VQLKPASWLDCGVMWVWRNSTTARDASINPAKIPLLSHLVWFSRYKRLKTPHIILMGRIGRARVGLVRFEVIGSEANLSFQVKPSLVGKGMGRELLTESFAFVRKANCPFNTFTATSKESNWASARLLEELGFTSERCGDGFVRHYLKVGVGSSHISNRPSETSE
jgi:GNAT superfamily N-acetyltransferase